jgi:hypothetical protein
MHGSRDERGGTADVPFPRRRRPPVDAQYAHLLRTLFPRVQLDI